MVLVLGIALIAAAAWHLAIQPMRESLLAERSELRETKSEIRQGSAGRQAQESDRVVAEIREHTDHYLDLWDRADDASGLYELIQNHAATAGVRIEHIEPRRGALPAELTKEFKELGVEAKRHSYSIELQGDFNSVRSFISTFQSDGGLARIDSFRLAAARNADDPSAISGSLSVSYFAVTGVFKNDEGAQP